MTITQSEGSTRLRPSLPANGNRDGIRNVIRLQVIWWWTKSQKKKIVSVNFHHAVFSLLGFLTWSWTDRLFLNISSELLLHNIQKSTDLTWQFGDAGLGLAPHGQVWSDPIWCLIHKLKTTSHICAPNLRENLVLHSSKYGTSTK